MLCFVIMQRIEESMSKGLIVIIEGVEKSLLSYGCKGLMPGIHRLVMISCAEFARCGLSCLNVEI